MDFTIYFKLLSLATFLTFSSAWPILPFQTRGPVKLLALTVSCGDNYNRRIIYNYALNLSIPNDEIVPGCAIEYRFAVDHTHDLEHYGIQISGSVDLQDAANDDSCSSTSLTIKDQDDPEELVHTDPMVICGKKDVTYSTWQDTVHVLLTVGENGATGSGITLLIQPYYICGGKIDVDTTITSPLYPETYPKGISCLWQIMPGSAATAFLDCEEFHVQPKKKNKCQEYLMVTRDGGKFEKYCGIELKGRDHALRFSEDDFMLYFRSNEEGKSFEGFNCTITFSTNNDARKLMQKLLG